MQATSGGALYRKSTFLLDSLGKRVLPEHIDIREDPHVPRGKGSAPFDDEGVRDAAARGRRRAASCGGYFLSTYSARKLGMRTTGHAGGSHNLTLTSRRTAAGDDLDAMLRSSAAGFFVIELMGQGVNYVTGDYSRGAAGFWVENGKIAYPVHEVTIAGNLREMFASHRRRRRRRLHDGQQDDRLGADRADEDRRRLSCSVGVRSPRSSG